MCCEKLKNACRFVGDHWAVFVNSASVLAFAITLLVQLCTFSATLSETKRATSVSLLSDLLGDFYGAEPYREIEARISSKVFRYNGNPDSDESGFGWMDVNLYLNQLERIALAAGNEVIDFGTLNSYFGAVYLEAYHNGEIRDFVKRTRNNGQQKSAFCAFQLVAEKIAELPSREKQADLHNEKSLSTWIAPEYCSVDFN